MTNTDSTATRVVATGERLWDPRVVEILRDISRGGFAGIVVGIVMAGVGGRIVMRLAAILVPGSVGSFTENGFRIGSITLGGSLGLVVFGLIMGLVVGTIWVIVSPWIPGGGLRRALITMPIAVAMGATFLIQGQNRDFQILRHDPGVVALLVALVALIGLSIALVDSWLDRRLPHAGDGRAGAAWLYVVVALIGTMVVLPLVVVGLFASGDPADARKGLALVAVGLVTLRWWFLRVKGEAGPPARLTIAGRAALLVAVILGAMETVPEVSRALAMT